MKLSIRTSNIHGCGLFASERIEIGERIILVGDLSKLSSGKFITPLGSMVNHQKNGNSLLKKQGCKFYLKAIRDINKGEEITSDYTQAPSPPFSNRVEGYV